MLIFSALGFITGLGFIFAVTRSWDWRWSEVVVVCLAVAIMLIVFFGSWGRS